jgi:hypothetical protein
MISPMNSKPRGRAPFSHGREQMAALNKSDEAVVLAEILAEGKYRDISKELVVVRSLVGKLYDEQALTDMRSVGGTIKLLLADAGFDYLGRLRINEEPESVWTKTPEKWSRDPILRGEQIRNWLKDEL